MFNTTTIKVKNIGKNLYSFITGKKSVEIEFYNNKVIVYYNMNYSFEFNNNYSKNITHLLEKIIKEASKQDTSIYNFFEFLEGRLFVGGDISDIKKILIKGENIIVKGLYNESYVNSPEGDFYTATH